MACCIVQVMADSPQQVRFSVSAYLGNLRALMEKLDIAEVEAAIELIRSTGQQKRKILVCGNGGSALTAPVLPRHRGAVSRFFDRPSRGK